VSEIKIKKRKIELGAFKYQERKSSRPLRLANYTTVKPHNAKPRPGAHADMRQTTWFELLEYSMVKHWIRNRFKM